MWVCTGERASDYRDQKKVWDPLELKLQITTNMGAGN